MLAAIMDIIANGDLEASVFENKPKVVYNMTTGEWVVTKCHPDAQFACAEREEGHSYVGQPIQHHFKGLMNPQCN